jgi:hypothetical protein
MSNLTWLITGASSGLGYALAEHVLKPSCSPLRVQARAHIIYLPIYIIYRYYIFTLGRPQSLATSYPREQAGQPGAARMTLQSDYFTCAPTAEYAVSSAVSGPEAEHPPTPTNASRASKRQSLRNPARIRNP